MKSKHTFPPLILPPEQLRLLKATLAEDVGPGDVTTDRIVPPRLKGHGELIAKARGIVCGQAVADAIWRMADRKIQVAWLVAEGQEVTPGDRMATLTGPMRGLLKGERVALNFLQRLSGVATVTDRFREAAGGHGGPVICDTRKTTPLWRTLERHAVRVGGGLNHRFGLFDMILIKENHARAAGGLREAIRRARVGPKIRIAAEARDEGEVRICCEERVDLILLDNFTPARARAAIKRFRPTGIPMEISGGVTLRNIATYAAASPDRISIGALTHSAPALDISLQLYQEGERATA